MKKIRNEPAKPFRSADISRPRQERPMTPQPPSDATQARAARAATRTDLAAMALAGLFPVDVALEQLLDRFEEAGPC
jgi:hypothetical protein